MYNNYGIQLHTKKIFFTQNIKIRLHKIIKYLVQLQACYNSYPKMSWRIIRPTSHKKYDENIS